MAGTFEERLSFLEEREESNSLDIRRLKTENADLLTKIGELSRDNVAASEKVLLLERKCKKVESDLRTVFEYRVSLESNVRI